MLSALEYVSKINPYVPGKPISELERELGISDSIKLASNENPLGPSPKAMKAIKDFLKNSKDLGRYPDGGGYYLKQALSERFAAQGVSVSPDELILGNGSNELLDIAVRTYMGPGDEAVMAHPSFVVYVLAVTSVGGTPITVPLTEYRHDLMKMADAITAKTKMVFIANPNNPTGTMNRREEFERFMARVSEDVLVVVDEAYYEYVKDKNYPDSLRHFTERRNILVLRTFSKIYGLAGLRIGYGIAKSDIITEMNKIREPFNTSTIAQVAALGALSDDRHVKKSVRTNEQGKKFLYREFDALGLRYVPTKANFVYLPLEHDSKTINEALLRKGVIVRPMGPKEIRITIGLPEENRRLIEALKDILQSK